MANDGYRNSQWETGALDNRQEEQVVDRWVDRVLLETGSWMQILCNSCSYV